MVVYTYLPEWLCALRVFGKCSHVLKLMAEELMGVLIAFQLGSQQPCKLDVFSSSIYHPRGVHCQAGEVWTTHHISLIQFEPVADDVEAHSVWHSIYRHTGEIFLEKEADIFLLFEMNPFFCLFIFLQKVSVAFSKLRWWFNPGKNKRHSDVD